MYHRRVYVGNMMETQLNQSQAFWAFGEKSKVSQAAGILPQHLSLILSGDRQVSVQMARRLEAATILVLGNMRRVPAGAWLRLEGHPAFEREAVGGSAGQAGGSNV